MKAPKKTLIKIFILKLTISGSKSDLYNFFKIAFNFMLLLNFKSLFYEHVAERIPVCHPETGFLRSRDLR